MNALWLAPLVLLLARGHDDVRASPVDGLFFALLLAPESVLPMPLIAG